MVNPARVEKLGKSDCFSDNGARSVVFWRVPDVGLCACSNDGISFAEWRAARHLRFEWNMAVPQALEPLRIHGVARSTADRAILTVSGVMRVQETAPHFIERPVKIKSDPFYF